MLAKGVKTIIVSDEANSLNALSSFISLYGVRCDVLLMNESLAQWPPVRPLDYDFLVLDLFELTPAGLDLVLCLRGERNCKPIIIVTNNSTRKDTAALARNHAVHLLSKPLDVSELLRAMESALEKV
jgi:DNA-binding response OmpR family regulator